MLLKALYDLAHAPGFGILDDIAFETRTVRWIVDLDARGNLLNAAPVDTSVDGKRGFRFPKVPRTARVKKGKVAEFLADGIDSVFGLSPSPSKPKNLAIMRDKYDDFWRQIEEAATATRFPALIALQRYRPSFGTPPSFVKANGNKWIIRTASGGEIAMGADQFTFRVDGILLFADETCIQPYWRGVFDAQIKALENESPMGACMITGSPSVPIARTHTPRIGNIPGVGIDGALVSFEKSAPAFSSYGKEQSLNAPCSISSTWAYSLALQYLVDHEKHHVRVSGTKCCFWAQGSEQNTVLFSDLLNSPQPDEIRKFMLSPWAGISREKAQQDRFFAITLAGNSGRIAVRHWIQCPLDQAINNLSKWFTDLQLEIPPMPAKSKTRTPDKPDKESSAPLSLFRLACTTIREAKDLQPEVPAMLYRAALEGSSPTVALLQPILHRLHSRLVKDENYRVVFDESRFALLKLIVNRNRKESDMEIQPKLTADTTDPAYNCGRLLAVFDALQQSAHRAGNPGGNLNNTIAEKYFASASGSPSSAFAILWRLHQHHLKKLRQSGKESTAASCRAQIAEISTRFQIKNADGAPVFPRTLTLMEQARFALGFYQQEAARMEAIRKWKEEQGAKAGAELEILT